jgi:mxaA protein
MKYAMYVVALVLACTSQAATAGASSTVAPTAVAPTTKQTPQPRAVTDAVVEQPRLTGYFVGDLLTQRVLLQRDGKTFAPVTLPPSGRVSAWFERRHVTVTTDAALQRWLLVEYQILNAPPKLTDVKLPAWRLTVTSSAGGASITLRVPSASINIAPLSPPGSPEQVGTRDLRPDRLPPAIPTAPIRRAIALSSSTLALTLIAWIGWVAWRNRRAVAMQPFARALREMRALDDREPRAWQALHRAFDRTAGRAIQSATLPVLFERAPQLAPARAQIENFFAQSNFLFFGSATTNGVPVATSRISNAPTGVPTAPKGPGASPGLPAPSDAPSPSPDPSRSAAPPLRALCAELRRIERRNEP